jgi:TRAP-type C4-dicarboxylate transport system substrate-binding protein
MHRSGRGFRVAVVAVSALLVVSGCSSTGVDRAGGSKPEPVVTLKLLNTRSSIEVAPFIATLAKVSGDALTLRGGSQIGSTSATGDVDTIRAIQRGDADVAIIPARAFHEVGVATFDALVAPMAVDSLALQQKVLAGTMPSRMLSGVDTLGLVGIGILPGPMRKPAGITRPLLAPKDFKGATIAFNRSAVADRALRALGATPVESPFNGAVLTGDDGLEQQVSSVAGNRYDSVVRSITVDVNLWPRPNVVVGNANALRRLTSNQLGQLRTAVHDALDDTVRSLRTQDSDSAGVLCRRGNVTFDTATTSSAEWRSAFTSVDEWLRQDRTTAGFLDEITELRAQAQPVPEEQLRCSTSRAATGASTRPPTASDGVYTMDTSEADGMKSDPNIVPENWGHWVFVFGAERFAFTQENAQACTWGYGTYTVTDGRIVWKLIDGGGDAPNGAVNKPGEEFVFGWTRYRDTLTLTAVPGAVSPDNYFLRPWHRADSRPSAALLSKRCPPPMEATTW